MTDAQTYTIEDGYVIDANRNRASIAYWGSEESAKASLATLTRCSDCSDCSRCSDCSDCSRCSDCSDCSRCSGCSDKRNLAPAEAPPIPIIPNIHRAILAAIETKGNTLDMSDWHKCDTTHCWGGWTVNLAGEAGKALESRTSTLFAAMQIYKASGYPISPCRFYESNDTAMAEIRRLAAMEGAA